MPSRLAARHDLATHVLPAMNISNGQSMIVHEDKYSAIRWIFNRVSAVSPDGRPHAGTPSTA
jgi:hypothetical protein